MKIVSAIFEEILNFFLMWTTLNFGGRSKKKKWAKNICRGTLDIECEWEWSVGLGATLGDGQKIRNYFSSFREFSGKSWNCHILGLQCSINPQNLFKIVGAIFEKIKFFFHMWTTLNFRGRGITKKTAWDIYKRTLDIEFEWDQSIVLRSTIGDGQTDTHTDIFYKTHF